MATEASAQPSAKTFTPDDIVGEVLAGRVRVPSFQGKFRWQWRDVQRLFDSIVKGYPIGSLLLWERPARKERIRAGALEIEAPQTTALFVVDGQQRVTSLANALTEGGAGDPTFGIAYDVEAESFTPLQRGDGGTLVPLYVIFDLQRLLQWFSERPGQTRFLERATRIAKAIRQYNIPAYVVKHEDEDVVRDIFDRMNTHGKRLSRAETFSALRGAEPGSGGGDVHLSDIAEAVDASTGFGQLDEDTTLRALLTRRGADTIRDVRDVALDVGGARDVRGVTREEAYQGRAALERAVRFLQTEAGVPHLGLLPYRYLVVVLARFFAHYPNPSSRIQTLLRRFFWRAALAGPDVLRGSSAGAMAALVSAITPNDQTGSVDRLLAPFQARSLAVPSLDALRTRTADGRVIMCALWSLKPRSPVDGAEYDIDRLRRALDGESAPRNAVRLFLRRAPSEHRMWAANRAILLDEVEGDARDAFDALSGLSDSAQSKILDSHALDKAMLKLLQGESDKAFLEARQERLAGVVRGFVGRMTESAFEDTPPLDDLDLDQDGERDDALG